jgi:hypothetical protein
MRKLARSAFAFASAFAVLAGCSSARQQDDADERFQRAVSAIGDAVRTGNPDGRPTGSACAVDHDCYSGDCKGNVCQPETCDDGILNGNETDVDCGGGTCGKCGVSKQCFDAAGDCAPRTPDGAPTMCFYCMPSAADPKGDCNIGRCEAVCGLGKSRLCYQGEGCWDASDCTPDAAHPGGACENQVCVSGPAAPAGPVACNDHDGKKNCDETDVDCGGPNGRACDTGKACLAGLDCVSQVCGADKKCEAPNAGDAPSCRTIHGGTTCGTGEFGDPNKHHESCCKSLPVPGYADPREPGKTVYLDKYEITAGRMRAFLDAMAQAGGGEPNVKGWMASHRPARWNAGWENTLPSNNTWSEASFTVASPTVDLLYPGPDKYAQNMTISTWGVHTGNFTVNVGVFFALGSSHFFPEYYADASWPSPEYAATHDLNCYNGHGAWGYSTYWFDAATVANYSGGVGKAFSKDVMDEKALNCTPFGMYAAFCAWDGGQLATSEVMDYVTSGRISAGASNCNGVNSFSDGTQSCPQVYYYPPDPPGNDYDGSARIAAPGRVAADAVAINAGDEPWMDLKGNLLEAVMLPNTTNFDYRGYGVSWGSIVHHKNQISTPRMKGGAFGARCMRFK